MAGNQSSRRPTSFKEYISYRPAPQEWLVELPAHWETRRLKFLLNEIDERSSTGSEELYSLSGSRGLVPYEELMEREPRADSLKGYKKFGPGDIVMNKLQAWNGMFAYSDTSGIISPEYTVLRPNASAVAKYYVRLFRTQLYVNQFMWRSRGMGIAFLRLYTDDFGDVLAHHPPVEEQRAIAAFLDRETAKIDALIEKKQRLIELLEEKRTALISHAVTKGLDPDAPMKDSGVEWLGEVPEHWDAVAIKHVAGLEVDSFTDGDWIESPYIIEEGIRLIQTGNIGVGVYREQGYRYISRETFVELGCTEFHPGDILICRLADPVGRACLAPDLGTRMITSVDVCILKPRSTYDRRFLVYFMSSTPYLRFVSSISRGSTRDRISRSMLGDIKLAIPTLEEQKPIADFLDENVDAIYKLVDKTERAIDLLQEYRTSLISAAVTGKIDVRDEIEVPA